MFNALDLDASGALSRAEYHKATSEFFYGDDPDSPANHIFGHLAGEGELSPQHYLVIIQEQRHPLRNGLLPEQDQLIPGHR